MYSSPPPSERKLKICEDQNEIVEAEIDDTYVGLLVENWSHECNGTTKLIGDETSVKIQ